MKCGAVLLNRYSCIERNGKKLKIDSECRLTVHIELTSAAFGTCLLCQL
jgi:hypothetical protein